MHLLQLSDHISSILVSSEHNAAIENLQLQQAATIAAAETQLGEVSRVYL